MGDTSIEWTQKTWNPTRGCSLVSPGCTQCYAMGQAHRFSGKGKPFEGLTKKRVKLGVVWTGKVRLAPEMLTLPLSWRKPQRVFVNSMSDLFHEDLTNEEIAAVFGVMATASRHTFQILTKRAKRMREWFEWATHHGHGRRELGDAAEKFGAPIYDVKRTGRSPWNDYGCEWPLPNVWLGVSAEDQQRADERVPELLCTPAAARFVSYEPALGPSDFAPFLPPKLGMCGDGYPSCAHSLANSEACLDWIIVGGESGPRARPFDVEWARNVVSQCASAGVACFVKQLGATPHHRDDGAGWADSNLNGRHWRWDMRGAGGLAVYAQYDRKGGDMAEWPADLRVRQFPKVRT